MRFKGHQLELISPIYYVEMYLQPNDVASFIKNPFDWDSASRNINLNAVQVFCQRGLLQHLQADAIYQCFASCGNPLGTDTIYFVVG